MKRLAITCVLALLLAGCNSTEMLRLREALRPGSEAPPPPINKLVLPPWEAYVRAGPGAENDLDLETLNGPQAPAEAPAAEAAADAKKKVAAKPGQIVIHAVAVPTVKGAKGDGNAELTEAMRDALRRAGWPVLNKPRKDALTVQGRVSLGAPEGEQQTVSVVWDVLSPDGKSLGDLKQNNAVPAGSLDQSWGENAAFAADAAAEGIFKLIQQYR